MATTSYQIGTDAFRPEFRGYMSGSYPSPVSVINTGSVTVYLDDEPQTDVSRGRPLGPGSTVVWEANTPLWLIAESAAGEVRISDSSGAMFDAGAIASQILGQGLAGEIASAISLSGVPVIDAPAELHTGTQTPATGVSGVSSPIIDVARYQSVMLTTLEMNSGTPPVGVRLFTVQWFADAAGAQVLALETFAAPISAGLVEAHLPVRGAFMRINPAGATTGAGVATLSVTVYGSYRAVVRPRMRIVPSGLSGSSGAVAAGDQGAYGGFVMSANVAVGATVVDYPVSYAGLATFHATTMSTTTNSFVQFILTAVGSGRRLASLFIPAGPPSAQNTSVVLPREPVAVTVINSTATLCGVFASLCMTAD